MVENPFPGMNPYLEQWPGDVHAALVVYASDQLQERLPSDLRARMGERTFFDGDKITESYIKILDVKSDRRVVTLIEFMSPWHKSHVAGQRLYRRQRTRAMNHKVNVVEIDLIRAGAPATLADSQMVAPKIRAAYHAVVWRASKAGAIEYYPFPLRERLPNLRIPLRANDQDALLELQRLINECYRRGRYDDIDYNLPLDPPLSAEDSSWAAALLKDGTR